MTGRQKIEAAFSKEGTGEVPVVICHERIFIRDHWKQLFSYPKWYMESPDLDTQILWRSEAIDRIGQDWTRLFTFHSLSSSDSEPVIPEQTADTPEEIDILIPVPSISVYDEVIHNGRNDLAVGILKKYGSEIYPFYYTVSPLCSCYSLWGFEGMMTKIATEPELVKHACRRYLDLAVRDVRTAALLGAGGIWIDEYFTDIISPDTFKELNCPFMKQLIDEIRSLRLHSIYYFCGNPAGKMEHIMSVCPDAIAFEESKKGFKLDIEDIVSAVSGRCTVLGNLDAIGILQDGTGEQLKTEIKRQLSAGRQNGGRFIMSTGSPVTPGTTIERVRLYCDLVREYGRFS